MEARVAAFHKTLKLGNSFCICTPSKHNNGQNQLAKAWLRGVSFQFFICIRRFSFRMVVCVQKWRPSTIKSTFSMAEMKRIMSRVLTNLTLMAWKMLATFQQRREGQANEQFAPSRPIQRIRLLSNPHLTHTKHTHIPAYKCHLQRILYATCQTRHATCHMHVRALLHSIVM